MRLPRLVAGAAIAASIAAGASACGEAQPAGVRSRDAELRAFALSIAKRNGDAHPTDATVVDTNRHAINALNGGADIPDWSAVYAVTLHGSFVGYDASPPAGAPLPTGHLLVLVFDRKTLRLDDWMLGDLPLDASRLGPSRPLDLGG